jgi:hypothetical protein
VGADDDVNKIFKRLQSRAEPPTTFKSSPGQMSGAPVEQLDDTCHGTLMSFSLTIRSAKEKEKKKQVHRNADRLMTVFWF